MILIPMGRWKEFSIPSPAYRWNTSAMGPTTTCDLLFWVEPLLSADGPTCSVPPILRFLLYR